MTQNPTLGEMLRLAEEHPDAEADPVADAEADLDLEADEEEPEGWWEHDLGGQPSETSPQGERLVAVTPLSVTSRLCAAGCGVDLTSRRSDAVYCSHTCWQRAYRTRLAARRHRVTP
jgi:hypothetical protein